LIVTLCSLRERKTQFFLKPVAYGNTSSVEFTDDLTYHFCDINRREHGYEALRNVFHFDYTKIVSKHEVRVSPVHDGLTLNVLSQSKHVSLESKINM